MKANLKFIFSCFFSLSLFTGVQAQSSQFGNFPQVERIKNELQRGVSTKQDIQNILGKPTGNGGYLAIMDGKPREVWYYHEIGNSMIDYKDSIIRMQSHYKVLLVFILQDKFDGYKWYSSADVAKAAVSFGESNMDSDESGE